MCGKICYTQRDAAEAIRYFKSGKARSKKHIPKRYYYCEICNAYHLTKIQNKKRKSMNQNSRKTHPAEEVDAPSFESQKKQILNALRRGEKLTALDMVHRFWIMNYTARISELRRQGHNIACQMIRTNNGKRIGLYSLQKNINQYAKILEDGQ